MSELIPFDSIRVGEELGPVEDLVTEDVVRQYCADWTDDCPWFTGPSPFGGPVVPPAYLAGLISFRLLATKFNSRATIGAQTSYRSLAPVRVGERITTRGVIADKYVKRRLEYVVITSTSYREDGTAFRAGTDHILLSLQRTTEATDDHEQ